MATFRGSFWGGGGGGESWAKTAKMYLFMRRQSKATWLRNFIPPPTKLRYVVVEAATLLSRN